MVLASRAPWRFGIFAVGRQKAIKLQNIYIFRRLSNVKKIYIFRRLSNVSKNSAAEISRCSAVFAIIVDFLIR